MRDSSCDPTLVAQFAEAPLRLASRASQLALLQTEQVALRLNAHEAFPIATRISSFSTQGDAIRQQRLTAFGGKGLFVRQLEKHLLAGSVDVAVHSGKDMETKLAAGTCLAAILPRGDRRDALVGAYASIDELPKGAVIGTASVRRTALLLGRRPDLQISLLRGNVPTRLQALKDGKYDAIILAKAGLDRLGIAEAVHPIATDIMLPAAAQGAIIAQARTVNGAEPGDHGDEVARRQAVLSVLTAVDDKASRSEVLAERRILAVLDGSCQTPIAASAEITDKDKIRLRAIISSRDGKQQFAHDETVAIADSLAAAETLATDLLARAGGRAFLQTVANDPMP